MVTNTYVLVKTRENYSLISIFIGPKTERKEIIFRDQKLNWSHCLSHNDH